MSDPFPAMPDRQPFEMAELEQTPEAQARRGWRVEVNGQELTEPISGVRLVNDTMGVDVTYGQRPEGYDGPIIHEPGGGGAVTIPYLIDHETGRIYVGVVEEERAPAGGTVRNIPRGFLDPGETHIQGAAREVEEETGIRAIAKRFIDLGRGINPNSTFFDTSRTTADGRPEGASIFGLPVRPDEVEQVVGENGAVTYRFKQDIRDNAEGDKTGERIFGSVFIPLGEAVKSPDIYTSAAAGRLTAHMIGSGVLGLAGYTPPDRLY